MKKKALVIAVLALLSLPLFGAKDTAPSTASLHINGYKKIESSEEVPQDDAELQSVVNINVFDNVSQRDNPLNPLSVSGEPVNVSVDKYLSDLYETPMSIATFSISGRVAPTADRYYGDGKSPDFNTNIVNVPEIYDITVEAGDALVHTKYSNMNIPCTISVDLFTLDFAGVDILHGEGGTAIGEVYGAGDGRPVRINGNYIGSNTQSYSESFVRFTKPGLKDNEVFALSAELRNYTAYHTDGRTYRQKGMYTAGNGGQRIDHLGKEWKAEGRIMFRLAEGFTKAEYEALPAGTYRVPVTFKVTVR